MSPIALQHIAGGDGWTAAKESDNVPPQYRFRWCICGFGMPLLQVLGMENSNMVCKFSFDEDVWPHRVQPLQPAFQHYCNKVSHVVIAICCRNFTRDKLVQFMGGKGSPLNVG